MSCSRTNEEPSTSEESPYKFSVKNVICNVNTSIEDAKDFKTPKKINIHSKPAVRVAKNVKKTKNSKRSKLSASQMRLTKVVKEDSQSLNVNAEQWQLAMTLSKSIQEQSGPGDDDEAFPYPSTQEKIATLKRNLERFGFNSGSKSLEVQHRKPVEKKKKKSKFQYVTPILFIRTQEDREKFISEKVSHVLSRNVTREHLYYSKSGKPFSEELQRYWRKNNDIYQLHGFDLSLFSPNVLYSKSLNLEPNRVKCGALLKDWSKIPGRDKSPVKEALIDLTNLTDESEAQSSSKTESLTPRDSPQDDEVIHISQKTLTCISPDLFSSDDETANQAFLNVVSSVRKLTAELNSSKEEEEELNEDSDSQSLLDLTPKKKSTSFSPKKSFSKSLNLSDEVVFENDKGICTYESFGQSKSSIGDCVDLTLSSEDERRGNVSDDDDSLPCFTQTLSRERSESQKRERSESQNQEQVESQKRERPESEERQRPEFQELPQKPGQSTPNFEPLINLNKDDSLSISRLPKRCFSFSEPASPRSRTLRRSKSLNVTDYIHNMLNQNDLDGDISRSLANHKSFSSVASDDLSSSQKSILISDEELNYSCKFSSSIQTPYPLLESKVKEVNLVETPTTSQFYSKHFDLDYSDLPHHPRIATLTADAKSKKSLFKDEVVTVVHTSDEELMEVQGQASFEEGETSKPLEGTPNSDVIIKTANVTPKIDYDELNTPKMIKELDKFGLKPMKRHRGAQLLKFIYETTHPYVGPPGEEKQSESEEENGQASKKRKFSEKSSHGAPKSSDSPTKLIQKADFDVTAILRPEIVEYNELIFERKQSKKILSCQLPLHIAWHNLVATNLNLKKNILLYEPIHLEVIYNMLKDEGHNYHIEDLLTFLDKKCITVRTNQGQNRRQPKKKAKSPRKKKKDTEC